MKFGIGFRKEKTGSEIYVRVFQIVSMLPALYFLVSACYQYIMTKKGMMHFLFNLGAASLPRWEALLLSFVYRLTSSEIVVFYLLMTAALAFGILAGRLLKADHKTARTTRIVLAVMIGCDLILRVLPFGFNLAFGWLFTVLGFIIRAACLALIIIDLAADKKARMNTLQEG